MAKDRGERFGKSHVTAISDPHTGRIITGRVTANANNFTSNLIGNGALPVRIPEPSIEGVVVKADAGNTGNVVIMEAGGEIANGYILAANQSISIHTDRLSKVLVAIAVNGEIVRYIALAQPEE